MDRIIAVALVVALAACAGPLAQLDNPYAAAAAKPRDVITQAELAAVVGTSAYDAIQQLRPEYFGHRGGRHPTVYLNHVRLGEPQALRDVPLSEVVEIRHLNSVDATTLFGTGNTDGAIIIVTDGKR